MKRKPKTPRTKGTPHLDPLPFGRGEEKPAAPVRGSAVADQPAHNFPSPVGGEEKPAGLAIGSATTVEPAHNFLSPLGGEDQGEGATGPVTRRARTLRKKATWAEKLLWSRLRNRQFAGYKFRRQHPVGPYNLDFYCAEARLAVELDGREHGHPDHRTTDKERDAFLAQLG